MTYQSQSRPEDRRLATLEKDFIPFDPITAAVTTGTPAEQFSKLLQVARQLEKDLRQAKDDLANKRWLEVVKPDQILLEKTEERPARRGDIVLDSWGKPAMWTSETPSMSIFQIYTRTDLRDGETKRPEVPPDAMPERAV